MFSIAFLSKNVQHPTYFAWSRSLLIFHFYPHSGTSFLKLTFFITLLAFSNLQRRKAQSESQQSLVVARSVTTHLFNNSFATYLLTKIMSLSNRMNCGIGLDHQLQPRCKWFCDLWMLISSTNAVFSGLDKSHWWVFGVDETSLGHNNFSYFLLRNSINFKFNISLFQGKFKKQIITISIFWYIGFGVKT